MNLHEQIRTLGDNALEASRRLASMSTRRKNIALRAMAAAVDTQRDLIKAANDRDLQLGREAGLSAALLDRLSLTDKRLDGIIRGLRDVADLPDPVGRCLGRRRRPNGLVILKQRVPIGVIVIIYESRPNVTADAAALCVKTGNAVILRGGKDAYHSNQALAEALAAGSAEAGLPACAVQCVATTDRDAVRELVQMDDRVDLVIPRGGESLIRAVVEQARVPVIKHYKGVCHIYVDESADLDMALAIFENAKCQRPGVCNAVETLLVHVGIAPAFLPQLAERCRRQHVEVRADEAACAIVPDFKPAAEADWGAEYLDRIVALRVVPDTESAIAHINAYGSRHSDAILTRDEQAAKAFTREVDSAAVYVNASTRFTDGGEFGMGAEMGISTDKLHARGPMGLEELTTYKYVIQGNGQIRA
ncbi:MAG: glutamate-5-semialdehyde dehydrogenase [Lentisphaerae bacterium]|nr:glutamate-5-semialdehyde dehydrogenase [Lentisphaerota bacterium]